MIVSVLDLTGLRIEIVLERDILKKAVAYFAKEPK
jgi:hypothetical protein